MNKKELVAAVAAKTEMTQVSVEKALKAIIEATTCCPHRQEPAEWQTDQDCRCYRSCIQSRQSL